MKYVVTEFLFWIFCRFMFFAYFCWTFIPDSILYKYGITYYPSKHWSLVISAGLYVLYNYVSNYYYLTSQINSVNIDSVNNIRDKHAKYSNSKPNINETRFIDIPVNLVSKELYN